MTPGQVTRTTVLVGISLLRTSQFITEILFISVWLVKDPRFYFPLHQDILKSIRGQKGESLENVYLWKTEIINLEKDFILKETEFDGVCQVELKVSNITLLPFLLLLIVTSKTIHEIKLSKPL